MNVTANQAPWTLLAPDLVLFERPPGPSGTRRQLVCRTRYCAQPSCDCFEVTLSAVGLELGARDATPLTSEAARALLGAASPMRAFLSLDSGAVDPDDDPVYRPLSDEWLQWLESAIDGELLDLFHAQWLAQKGRHSPTWPEIDWPTVESDEMLAWEDLHPEDRPDAFELEGRFFVAADLYCPNPACSCAEAQLEFVDLSDDEEARLVGFVRVGLPTGDVLERRSSGDPAALDAVWSAYRARHRRLGERLHARRRAVAALTQAHAAATAATPKRAPARVGRNDPCPCGSGKKHKQCCLGRPAPKG